MFQPPVGQTDAFRAENHPAVVFGDLAASLLGTHVRMIYEGVPMANSNFSHLIGGFNPSQKCHYHPSNCSHESNPNLPKFGKVISSTEFQPYDFVSVAFF
jgi:hypothetical protein